MPYHGLPSLPELLAALPPGRRLLGIDLGRRTIGLALSDAGLRLAGPYGQVRRARLAANAAAIAAIAAREEVGALVVGLPLSMDGRFGPAAQAARDWARDLAATTGLPTALWDERLTTEAAHETLTALGASPRHRAAAVDRLAAAVILQAALDSQ